MDLLNLRGLPVADNTARGQTIPYDIYFDVKTTSQQIGTNLDYYFTPILERKWITISSVGRRDLYEHSRIAELSRHRQRDVVLTAIGVVRLDAPLASDRDFKAQSFPNGIDDNQDGIIDNAVSVEAGPRAQQRFSTSTSTSTSGTVRIISSPTPFALLPATIDITTSSNLVGPTGGLRYLIGGKSFHIIGETKFGVMADFEQIDLSGNNIGSTTRVNGNLVNFPTELVTAAFPIRAAETRQDLIIPTPQNPNPNAFSSSQTHAHVSPYFEQSIIAEAPVLQYIPYVNKIWPLATPSFASGIPSSGSAT